MTKTQRAALIAQYRDGGRAVSEALQGATDQELDAQPAPKKWTAREIVHHLADSEMTAAIRLRRLLAEDQPVIHSYDEAEYARRLHYQRPIEASLEAFQAARSTTAQILDMMGDEEWTREGKHTDVGRYTPEVWLEIYAVHAHNHADQIRKARASAK